MSNTISNSNLHKCHLQVDPVQYRRGVTGSSDRHIQLVAESVVLGGGQKMANIFVSTRRGYLFIQKAKPIYNPGELGENAEPLQWNEIEMCLISTIVSLFLRIVLQ